MSPPLRPSKVADSFLVWRYFAGEIVGNLLDIEPRVWRHPRRVDSHHNKDRAAKFKEKYDQYDWTGLIGQS